jgi:Xaa-Pro aminopeptidase
LVAGLRLIKDASEVELIRHAARIQEAALLATLPELVKGAGRITEQDVAARLEAEMKRLGSTMPGFATIVAAEPNGSLPHYRAGARVVERNRSVLIDWGATFRGYHSDMTRVVAMGRWPTKIREIYEIVLEAQMTAAAALKPGKTTAEIDALARGIITKAGYGEAFGHGLGHGLGLNGHEEPRLTHLLAPTVLRPGQVVTVEPGIYLPGVGGVRIEDDYLVTEDGAECLCTLPKDLRWATL